MLIATLTGVGLGFLLQQEGNLEREVVQFRDLARASRAQARLVRAPAQLEITPPPGVTSEEDRRVVVYGQRAIGEWNFDRGRPTGSGGLGGEAVAGRVGRGGRFGQALWIEADAEGHGMQFDARTLPSFDLSSGFLARCDVFLEDVDTCVILRIGESFEIGVDASGVLTSSVTLTRGDGSAGRRVQIKGLTRLRAKRWYRLELEASSGETTLLLEGIVQGRAPIDAPVWRDPAGWLIVSDGANPVYGAIDSVSIFGMSSLAEIQMDPNLEIRGPARLAFDASGALDRRIHKELPTFFFRFGDNESELVFEREGLTR